MGVGIRGLEDLCKSPNIDWVGFDGKGGSSSDLRSACLECSMEACRLGYVPCLGGLSLGLI